MKQQQSDSRENSNNKSLKDCFFELNIHLALNNPISTKYYLLLLLLKTLIMVTVPFLIVIKHEDAISIQQKYDFADKDFLYETLLLTSCAISFLMVLVYAALLIRKKVISKISQQNNKISHLRSVHQIVMGFFTIQQTLLKIPMQMTYTKHLQEIITDGIQSHAYLTIICIISMVAETGLTIIYYNFLTVNLPIKAIPHNGQRLYLQQLRIVQGQVLALTYMTPSNLSYTPVIYAVLLVTTVAFLGLNLQRLESYNALFQFVINIQHSMIMATSITFLIKSSKPMGSISLINFLAMILGFSAAIQILKTKLIAQGSNKGMKRKLTELNDYVTFLLVIGQVQTSASMTQLFGFIAQLKICGVRHFKHCEEDSCECKQDQFHHLFLERSKHDTDEHDILRKKSTYVEIVQQMILILLKSLFSSFDHTLMKKSEYQSYLLLQHKALFYRFQNENHSLNIYYELLKNHNCKLCNMANCYTHHFLLKYITKRHQAMYSNQNSDNMFDTYIKYDRYFKQYSKCIEKINSEVQTHWKTMQQDYDSIRDFRDMQQTERILKSYKEFSVVNARIRKECGPTLHVELLLWKLYKDSLNFESESMDMFERLNQLLNNKKMTTNLARKINSSAITDEKIDSSLMMLLISGNPVDFHKIILVNKQFVINTGYQLEELHGKHIDQLFLAGTIENVFLQIFNIQANKQSEFEMTETVFMKMKTGTVVSMNIRVYINITEAEGIVIMCIMRPANTIELVDKTFPIQDVFFILTNQNNQLQYFSQNCIDNLKFTTHMFKSDIFMRDLFPMFDHIDGEIDMQEQDQGFLIELNRSAVSRYDYDTETKISRKNLSMQMFLSTFDPQIDKGQKLFTFFVTSEVFSQELKNPSAMSLRHEESFTKTKEETTTMMLQSEDYQQLQSISSTASQGPHVSAFKQLSDIKSVLDFKRQPSSLVKFKRLLFLIFILLLGTAITLLVVNFVSKTTFERDIKALQNQKLMRNNLSISRLSLVMMFGYAQVKESVWNDIVFEFDINTQQEVNDFFQANLTTAVDQLHYIISNFSTDSSQWDNNFVKLITGEEITMQVLSESGTITQSNQTFFNALQQYIYKADSIAQADREELVYTKGDFFELNTKSEYGQFLESVDFTDGRIIQDLVFCLFNGGGEIQDQMLEINQNFIEQIQSKADKTIYVLLIFTMVCGGLVIGINLLVLPFLFNLQSLQYHITVFNQQVNHFQIQDQLERIQSFSEYLKQNKYLSNMNARQRMQQALRETLGLSYKTMHHAYSMHIEKNERMQSLLDEQSVLEDELKSQDLQRSCSAESYDLIQKLDVPLEFKDNRELKRLVVMKKLYRFVAVLVLAATLGSFYIFSYFISSRILQNLQKGYFSYEVFYNRIPCMADSLYYMQDAFMNNVSLNGDDGDSGRLQSVINSCYANENNYKTVKYDINGMFQDLKTEIESQDGLDFCEWMASQGMDSQGCNSTAFGGYLLLPTDTEIQIVLTHVQNQQMKFLQYMESQRTSKVLQNFFYNGDTLNYALVQLKYVFNVFAHTQQIAHTSFMTQIIRNFKTIIVVFIVFMILVIALGIVAQVYIVESLHRALLTYKLTLKLIPSEEILRLKGLLAQIKVQQL